MKKNQASINQGQLFPVNEEPPSNEMDTTQRGQKAKKIFAIVKPDMLLWGREYAHLPLAEAARRIGISVKKLQEWERGVSSPTINQLHNLARVYRQSFAVFYLPSPPQPTRLPVRDFRRLPSNGLSSITYEMANEIRAALNRREIAIQLLEEAGEDLIEFPYSASILEQPTDIAERVRSLIFPNNFAIPSFRVKRIAFNFFRKRLEDIGILIFQMTEVATSEMRGFSISEGQYPIIAVNRKDSFSGRTFSLFHELTHILLRTSGICDLETDTSLPTEEQRVEVFCNQVAAEILMPGGPFTKAFFSEMEKERAVSITDQAVTGLADTFGVSREAVVRRLLTLGFVTKDFYQQKREQLIQELTNISKEKKKGGRISHAQDIVSQVGKPYVRIIFNSIETNRITLNDASEFLNIRINQLPKAGKLAGIY